jgi:hypothetical protein
MGVEYGFWATVAAPAEEERRLRRDPGWELCTLVGVLDTRRQLISGSPKYTQQIGERCVPLTRRLLLRRLLLRFCFRRSADIARVENDVNVHDSRRDEIKNIPRRSRPRAGLPASVSAQAGAASLLRLSWEQGYVSQPPIHGHFGQTRFRKRGAPLGTRR